MKKLLKLLNNFRGGHSLTTKTKLNIERAKDRGWR